MLPRTLSLTHSFTHMDRCNIRRSRSVFYRPQLNEAFAKDIQFFHRVVRGLFSNVWMIVVNPIHSLLFFNTVMNPFALFCVSVHFRSGIGSDGWMDGVCECVCVCVCLRTDGGARSSRLRRRRSPSCRQVAERQRRREGSNERKAEHGLAAVFSVFSVFSLSLSLCLSVSLSLCDGMGWDGMGWDVCLTLLFPAAAARRCSPLLRSCLSASASTATATATATGHGPRSTSLQQRGVKSSQVTYSECSGWLAGCVCVCT